MYSNSGLKLKTKIKSYLSLNFFSIKYFSVSMIPNRWNTEGQSKKNKLKTWTENLKCTQTRHLSLHYIKVEPSQIRVLSDLFSIKSTCKPHGVHTTEFLQVQYTSEENIWNPLPFITVALRHSPSLMGIAGLRSAPSVFSGGILNSGRGENRKRFHVCTRLCICTCVCVCVCGWVCLTWGKQ